MRKIDRTVRALVVLVVLISVVYAATTSADGVEAYTNQTANESAGEANPSLPWSIPLRLVVDDEDNYGGLYPHIVESIKGNLSKIGITVYDKWRDGATFAYTVWGSYWDKTWNEAPDLGWDMAWYRFPRPRSWAVIVCTSAGLFDDTADAHYIYHVLTEHYNFNDESICYLSTDTRLPGVDYIATEYNLRWAIKEWLRNRSDADDLIFIYIVGHGGGYKVSDNEIDGGRIDGSGGDPVDEGDEHLIDGKWEGVDECLFLDMYEEYYWDDELRYDLSTLSYSRLVFARQGCVGNQSCYSGGLIDDISALNRIIMTSSNETSYSLRDMDGDGFSEWSEAFIDALHGEDTLWDTGTLEVIHTGYSVDADINNDGRVSMLEAWEYAWDYDDARLVGYETPWLDDNGNGEPTYKNGHDVNAPRDPTDGQLASQTYLPMLKDPEKELDEDLRSHYWANMTPPKGGYNIMCWNNTKADEKLCQALNTPSALAKKSDIWKWQIMFMHDPPAIIIYYPYDSMCARGIAFNLHHPVLSNRYVRLAIAHAIPYEYIIDTILLDRGIKARQGKAPIHPNTTYTDPNRTVNLFNDVLQPYQTNVAQAIKYMEMWWYSKDGKDKMKGPRGDSDFSGFVELDDFYIWVKWWGKTTSQIKFLPGQDQDPDWDNSGYVEMPDFYEWTKAWGFYYPENSTEHKWSRSPVVPVGATEYPAIYVEPASIEKTTYEPGMEFTVSIRTNYTGADVTGWQFTLYYNPLVLQGVNVTNGDLITKEKDSSAQFIAGTFDNTAGRLSLTGAFFFFIYEPAPLTSGPGILAKVTFKVVGWGDSGILLGDKTKLIGFTEGGWGTIIDIIDASTDPNHIQNGFFSNLVLTIRPNAPGTFTRWTAYPNGTPNWQCVDEANPNDDVDYVYWTPQPSKRDSYNLEDHTTETRNITNVRVVMYAKLASADDDQITMQLVINGMTYEGVTVNPTTTYAKYTSDWAINPSTGSAWTWSDIDTLEAGFKCVKVGQTSPEHRITQLYVEVTLPRS